jgi:hypothetical protein
MDKADIIRQAIREINPTAKFIIRGETPQTVTIDGVEWNNDTTPIATADIEAKMIEVQAAYDAKEYARNREAEYPTIQECVHAILDDDLDALQVLRQAVKDKYPKE